MRELGHSSQQSTKGENHMSVGAHVVDPQSASLALTLLQSKAGNRSGRAVEEMKTNRLRVAGDFPEFIVTNKSGTPMVKNLKRIEKAWFPVP
ncbi:MAG: hypothetical protein DMG39_25450 [Acidobacteria bacterium]|nr:MAG: hypothetical protein DMG39_25450 [Acidobacteriota bacterium]